MLITQDTLDTPYPITRYDNQSITVGGVTLQKSFILFPHKLISDYQPQSFNELTEQCFQPIIDAAPELLIIGTGLHSKQLPAVLRYFLESQRIGIECMNTAAACRSYTVLLLESRNMAALFFFEDAAL